MDLAKSFDTVPPNTLLDVLAHYDKRGIIMELIQSYLFRNTQSTKTNNTFRLLYLEVNGKIISFADDTVVIFQGDSVGKKLNKKQQRK